VTDDQRCRLERDLRALGIRKVNLRPLREAHRPGQRRPGGKRYVRRFDNVGVTVR
jgi:hypothetical protein